MKKEIAGMLVKLASKIYEEAPTLQVPNVENYVAKKVAIATSFGKKDVKRYKSLSSTKLSSRGARKLIIRDLKKDTINSILKRAVDLIEINVYGSGEETIVEGKLNVYVRKEDEEVEE